MKQFCYHLLSLIFLLLASSSILSVEAQNAPMDSVETEREISQLVKQADLFKHKGDYPGAITCYKKAKELSQQLAHRSWESQLITELGVMGIYQGRYSEALKLLQEGLVIRESLGDSSAIAESYNYIATIHHAQRNFSTALIYYGKGLSMRERIGDQPAIGVSLNNLGSLAEDMGNYQEAIRFHKRSMEIWESIQDTSWLSVSQMHLGYCYKHLGEYNLALEFYLSSIDLASKRGMIRNVISYSVNLGELYLEMGEFYKAQEWCEKALVLSENQLLGSKESCQCLYKAYEASGQLDKAYVFYKKYISARDSIFSNDRIKELTTLELNFEFQREQLADSLEFAKDQAIKDSRIKRQRVGLFSAGSMLVLIIVLAFTIYYGKRRSEQLLLNILPAQIAEELKATGAAKAKRLENVTVLFTDFKGFTSISERLPAEDLVADIHACFSEFDQICGKYGIEKIKTIGDAYMAAGGVPQPKDTHAVDVVNAALEMAKVVEAGKAAKLSKDLPFFEVRIGVHTGPVVAGIVGIKKFQYDIWGDTVNTASRMESSGEVGKVNISETTYQLVKDRFACEYRGEIEAKGKGKVKMYFVEDRA